MSFRGMLIRAGLPTARFWQYIQYAEVDILSSEVLLLRASPKELVRAPGANRVIEFVSAMLMLDYGGTNGFTESADNMAVEYGGGAAIAASVAIEATGFLDQTADTITNAIPVADAIDAAADIMNKNLALANIGDGEYAGNAAGDNILKVRVAYRIRDFA